MCNKRDPIEPGALEAQVWLLLVGHWETAVQSLARFVAMRQP